MFVYFQVMLHMFDMNQIILEEHFFLCFWLKNFEHNEKNKKSDIPAKAFRPKFAVGGFDQDMNEWNSSGDAGK